MPPLRNYEYHVNFYYFGYSSPEKFWQGEGKFHSKIWDKFIGPGPQVKTAAAALISANDTPQVKLKKIYDAIEQYENTDFTREHTKQENEVAGVNKIHTTDDVLQLKSGDSSDLTMLFVAMVRTVGLNAYLVEVADRSKLIFDKNLMDWNQFRDFIAIANIDGKDVYLDPGSRYCRFGQLNWKHTDTMGVRQNDGDTELITTPFMDFKQSICKRAAVLSVDDTGKASGTLQEVFDGIPALNWRQAALKGDSTSLNKQIEESVAHTLPGGMDIKVQKIANLTDPDKPLAITFSAKGPIGTVTGKRLLIQADLYQSEAKPLLTEANRITPVDFSYAATYYDILKIQLPDSLKIEQLPDKQSFTYKNFASYEFVISPAGLNAYLVQRQYALANYLYTAAEYSDTRNFLNKVAQADQSEVLIKRGQ